MQIRSVSYVVEAWFHVANRVRYVLLAGISPKESSVSSQQLSTRRCQRTMMLRDSVFVRMPCKQDKRIYTRLVLDLLTWGSV